MKNEIIIALFLASVVSMGGLVNIDKINNNLEKEMAERAVQHENLEVAYDGAIGRLVDIAAGRSQLACNDEEWKMVPSGIEPVRMPFVCAEAGYVNHTADNWAEFFDCGNDYSTECQIMSLCEVMDFPSRQYETRDDCVEGEFFNLVFDK